MEIRNHLLKGEGINFVKSPTVGSEFKAGNLDTIVMHYTAGPTAESAVRTLTSPKIKASAHLVIGRDGAITQLVPFNIVAWHAGSSSYNGRVGYNQYSIGIEIVNVGYLSKSGDVYRSVYGNIIDTKEVLYATHRNQSVAKYWQTYTQEQIEAIEDVSKLLIDTYGIKYILGHEEIAPLRKTDPGPAFPLDKLRDRLLHGDKDTDEPDINDEGKVLVDKLNIRSIPSIAGELMSKPIPKGTKFDIVDEKNGWYRIKVKTEVEGWVLGKFLDEA